MPRALTLEEKVRRDLERQLPILQRDLAGSEKSPSPVLQQLAEDTRAKILGVENALARIDAEGLDPEWVAMWGDSWKDKR